MGDDPTNVVDQSDSPLTAIPLVDLSWVDPKVVEISSTYKTEDVVTKFLDKHPILKAGGHSRVPIPPSSTCTLVSSQTYMSPSHLINS